MAVVASLATDRTGRAIQAVPPGVSQTVAYTGTAGVTTNPIGSTFVRIVCTSAAFVAFGAAPTATTADMYIPANSPEWIPIDPSHKVSVVRLTDDGTAYIMAAG